MSNDDGFRRHHRRHDRRRRHDPRRPRQRFAHLQRRQQHRLGRRQRGGGNTPNVAGAQEVVLSTSGGLGEAETSGVILNVIPRDGGNNFSGQFSVSGANGAMQGSNYTQSLQDQGLRTPSELMKVYDVNPMGGGRIIRDKLWFYLTYRQTGGPSTRCRACGSTRTPAIPNAWTVDFDRTSQAFRRQPRSERHRAPHVAGHAAQQDQSATGRSSTTRPARQGRRHRDARRRKPRPYTLFQPSHINWPAGRRRSRAGFCWKPAGAATSRGTATPDRAPTAPTTPG